MNEFCMKIRKMITHHLVKGEDLNHHGTLFAARMAEWFVEAGFISAAACVPAKQIVLVKINSMDFVRPVKPGEILRMESAVVSAGRTSLVSHITASVDGVPAVFGFITFVNVDEAGKPMPHGVEITPETEEERKLQKEAGSFAKRPEAP